MQTILFNLGIVKFKALQVVFIALAFVGSPVQKKNLINSLEM